MIEKKLAIRPNRPTVLTKSPTNVPSPLASSIASGSGLSESLIASAPPPPGVKSSISAAKTSRIIMAAIRPRGMSFFGSRVSSAASGTPSTARKNQIANGKAAQMPCQPNGRKSDEPALPGSGSMLVRLEVENSGIIATTKTSSATTAIAVMTNVTLSASPTPSRWMPTKAA